MVDKHKAKFMLLDSYGLRRKQKTKRGNVRNVFPCIEVFVFRIPLEIG